MAVDHKKIFWPKEFVSRNTDTNVNIKHITCHKNNDPFCLRSSSSTHATFQIPLTVVFMLSCSQTKNQQEVKTHGLALIQRAGAEKKEKKKINLPPLCERNLTS